MGYNRWVESKGKDFSLYADNWGNYTLVRHSDGASLFMQGDDARAIDNEVESSHFNVDNFGSDYLVIESWDTDEWVDDSLSEDEILAISGLSDS